MEELVFVIRISVVVLETLLRRFIKLLAELAIREGRIGSSFSIHFLFLLFCQKLNLVKVSPAHPSAPWSLCLGIADCSPAPTVGVVRLRVLPFLLPVVV